MVHFREGMKTTGAQMHVSWPWQHFASAIRNDDRGAFAITNVLLKKGGIPQTFTFNAHGKAHGFIFADESDGKDNSVVGEGSARTMLRPAQHKVHPRFCGPQPLGDFGNQQPNSRRMAKVLLVT
jgi:hypothetical protein